MPLIRPDDPAISIPLRIAQDDSLTGARFGGRPPAGILQHAPSAATTYFATIPLAEAPVIEMSVFLTRTLVEMMDVMGELWTNDDPVIVISHPPSKRGESETMASSYSSHAIILGEPRSDTAIYEGDLVVLSDHKIGGKPYFVSGDRGLEDAVLQCLDQGFFQAVQFDFPGPEDAGDEEWPFGDGVFHVLARPPFGKGDFRSFWEF
ncbi:MAG TPA: hypothetical protein VEZ90_11080 [Blastocatellia bacterium]|nr:hypothetical protein [Blastocatellia bacterium]